ncbi:MAG: MotA/TolQ/ExbB proton channel family protein [Desulfobacterota bacterium]|nr:MotA/TolQ/ExbB proton channel family protein [Thermodesulfobacteriota bacterium]
MFVSLLIKGGVIMIPIILGSVIALAIVLDRLWALWRIRLNLPRFTRKIFEYLDKGQFQKALEQCARVRHPIGNLFRIGILNRHLSRQEIEAMMEREGDEQIQYLERYMSALIIIVGVEPMMGFLGTIIGLIQAFMAWEQMGANITVNALAAGIYQAMITTAAGLSVAIPGFIFYHLIMGRIRHHAQEMTYYGNELLDLLSQSREGGAR